jgi:hypothetical protein
MMKIFLNRFFYCRYLEARENLVRFESPSDVEVRNNTTDSEDAAQLPAHPFTKGSLETLESNSCTLIIILY